MSEQQYTSTDQVEVDTITKTIEQRIAAGAQFDGAVPSLSTLGVGEQDFVPFFDLADGVFRMKNPGPLTPPGTVAAGDHGGLWILPHEQPIWMMQFFADLGTSQAWTLQVVLKDGSTVTVATATNRYITLLFGTYRLMLNPHERLKLITTTATAAMWARAYMRLEQAGV